MKIRVGVIGLGVGETHIEGYKNHPGCEVTALCDFSKERLAAAQRYPAAKITTNADEILEAPDIDAVSIASYDNYHYEQTVKAINNNKHVFVEKPLCLHEKEALHIRRLLDEKPRIKLSSNLILRKSPRFIELRKLIREGRIGRLYYAEGDYNYGRLQKITEGWRGRIDYYSVVYGGGVHIVDLLLWLTDDKVIEVVAYGNNISTAGTSFKHNDMVAALLKFKSGLIGKVSANFGSVSPHFHGLLIYGTKATFVNDLECGKLFESRDPSGDFKRLTAAYPGVHKGDLIKGFVDSIINDTPCEISKDDVFKAISVCFAIEKAAKSSGPVKVRYI